MSMKSTRTITGPESRKGSKKSLKNVPPPPVEPEVKLKVYEQVMFERRVLLLCTFMVGVMIIVWIVAIATDYWFILDGGEGIFIPATKRYFTYSHSGIWKICRYAFSNGTGHHAEAHTNASLSNHTVPVRRVGHVIPHKTCWNHQMFSVRDVTGSTDTTIVEYNKVEGVFSGIAIVLMVMGVIFSLYCFKNARYMFKRTAGAIHFLSMGSCLTVIEVMVHSIEYEKKNIPFIYPPGAKPSYGFSFVLALLVLICNFLSGILFMLYSRKRKGKKAPTEEMGMIDEPTIIGR